MSRPIESVTPWRDLCDALDRAEAGDHVRVLDHHYTRGIVANFSLADEKPLVGVIPEVREH